MHYDARNAGCEETPVPAKQTVLSPMWASRCYCNLAGARYFAIMGMSVHLQQGRASMQMAMAERQCHVLHAGVKDSQRQHQMQAIQL